MHCLLLGNGLNRLSNQINWRDLITTLAADFSAPHLIEYIDHKPFSLIFEELCAHASGNFQAAERKAKRGISKILQAHPIIADDLQLKFAEQFDVILTTNYDTTLENSVAGPMCEKAYVLPESRYSLFRRKYALRKEIWHIHGEVDLPETILLGYDHYAGYLQKIRNYLTSGSDRAKAIIAESRHNRLDQIETNSRAYSWVDHFLDKHLHIVGLSLEFTEIDLWWLLLYKRRREKKTGHTFYYDIQIPCEHSCAREAKLSVLKSLGVQVFSIDAITYHDGYKTILETLKENICSHPMLLEYTSTEKQRKEAAERELLDRKVTTRTKQKDAQLNLKLRRSKNTP